MSDTPPLDPQLAVLTAEVAALNEQLAAYADIPRRLAALEALGGGDSFGMATSIGAGTVTQAMLAANVAAKLLSPGVYSARTLRVPGEKFLASATKHTFVTLEVTAKASTATVIGIRVGGVRIAFNEIPAAQAFASEVPFGFVVPAGLEWEIEANAGIKEAASNYLFLN